MDRMTLFSRVGPDGVLHVHVPVGTADANRSVQLTIEPAAEVANANGDYQRWLENLSGRWEGEFVRRDEGPFEMREPLP